MKRVRPVLGFLLLLSPGCQARETFVDPSKCTQFGLERAAASQEVAASVSNGAPVMHRAPSRHLPIPQGAIDTVRIVLERGQCLGTCPDYRVEIRGDGTVLFQGNEFVMAPGAHRRTISPISVLCLLNDFKSADFWSLDPDYSAPVTDLPGYEISLTIGGSMKRLRDYGGDMVGMPVLVTALENMIDRVAHTDDWISGTGQTIGTLQSEGFDFRGRAAGQLLVRAMEKAPDALALGLLARGAPLNAAGTVKYSGEAELSAVEAAAMFGRLAVLKELVRRGAFERGGKALVSATLRASVASEDPAVVAEVLKYGPDVNSKDRRGDTALALIYSGAHPHRADTDYKDRTVELIRLLGKAGADPNIPTADHESLLSRAYSLEEKQALLAIGARPDRASTP